MSDKKMSDEEYKQLEYLLTKLEIEFGCKYCVIPNYVHDGPYIALYNKELERYKDLISYSIKDCVRKHNDETTIKKTCT